MPPVSGFHNSPPEKDVEAFKDALASCKREAISSFGDDKVLAPASPAALVAGERYTAPELGSQYTQAGYRRALPQDTVLPGGIIRGEHYIPATGQYGGYVRAMPSAFGSIPGRGPVQVTSEPSGFDLRDGLFAAMAALGLALLAFGAMLISRHSGRPETA